MESFGTNQGGMEMLKTGLALLAASSLAIFLRFSQLDAFMGPTIYDACLMGLSLSFMCFLARYAALCKGQPRDPGRMRRDSIACLQPTSR